MNLTKSERLILVNQYKILSFLNSKDEIIYQDKISILENGFEGLYESIASDITDDVLSTEETKFVLDVLEMYGTGLILSAQKIKNCTIDKKEFYFPGFNTNDEIRFYSFIIYFIEELGRYSEIDEINKGNYRGISDNINRYELMLNKWKQFGKYNLNESQIREILLIR